MKHRKDLLYCLVILCGMIASFPAGKETGKNIAGGLFSPGITVYADEDCDHEWTDWEVKKAATVKKEGTKVRECEICEKTETKSIAKLKPYVKISKKKYSVKAGKKVKIKLKYAKGDKVKKWKSSRPSVASVNSKGKVKGKKAGTAKITVTMKSGKKASCKVKVTALKKKSSGKKKSGSGTVYWVANGKVYHKSKNCSTLKRSKNIYSGTIEESGKSRLCKVCG